jgi:hypothetical protein
MRQPVCTTQGDTRYDATANPYFIKCCVVCSTTLSHVIDYMESVVVYDISRRARGSTFILHSFIHSSMALQPFVGPWPLLQFRNLFYIDGRTPWKRDQPVAWTLPTHRTTQTQNKRTHTHTHTHTHTQRHPCLEWDSNTRPERLSERRQFMP